MRKSYKIPVLFILIQFFAIFGRSKEGISFAQNRNIDSLKILIQKDKLDTNNVHHLNKLCEEYKKAGLYDTAIIFGKNALQLAQQLNFKKGIIDSYNNMGFVFFYKDDYSKTLECFFKALRIAEDLKDISSVTTIQGNVGVIYMQQGNYSKALESYFKALKIFEKLGDMEGVASNLGNIGFAYWSQGDFPKALEYYFKALEIAESIGNKGIAANNFSNIGLAYWKQASYPKAINYYLMALRIDEELGDKNSQMLDLGNIGLVYSDQNDLKALEYYSKALKIAEELGSKYGMALNIGNIGGVYDKIGDYSKALNYYLKGVKLFEELGIKSGITTSNIGLVYQKLHDYPKALDYHLKALKISEELGDRSEISRNMSSIGSLYTEIGKYTEAEQFLKKAIAIDDSIGALNELRQAELYLSQLYDTTGRYKEALIHYKKSIAIKDTIFSQENKKELVRKEMNYEFDKKETITKAENEKQQAIVEEKSRKQRWVLVLVSCVLILVFAFAGFIFRALRITRKQKQIIETKNKETEEQKKVIQEQKKVVEEKNKDITDSINYAKRIQRAMLPHRRDIWTVFPKSFVLFKPKDIVSGDFYFFHKNDQSTFIAVADCTGHGVPGAFMSMIGAGKLNDAVSESSDPSKILSLLNKGIKTALKQSDGNESTRDGMDIALCAIDVENRIVKYAGANRPIWIVRKGQNEVDEIKATKKAIGGLTEDNEYFDSHELKLQQGDTFYICTDGYADQFGKLTGKKLMTKKLKEVIIEIQNKPMKEQELYLDNFVENWKAGAEQVDDILIIGIQM
ncbi:MAG: tetratricopeptide repeat protein [Bacteroidota bacterium]